MRLTRAYTLEPIQTSPQPKQLCGRKSEQRSFPGSKLVRREVTLILKRRGQARKHDRWHVSSIGHSNELIGRQERKKRFRLTKLLTSFFVLASHACQGKVIFFKKGNIMQT